MAYQRGQTARTAATVLTVEQARRRNAELRRELVALNQENVRLEAQTETMRLQITAARRNLTSKVRQLDATRAQVERLGEITIIASTLPEPKYGGRAGLQAAADEMAAHEARGASRARKGPSHGTERIYAKGCRCDDCMSWRMRRSAQAKQWRAA